VTDDLTPDSPDRRDDRLAELLEVPPLDEVTRRRLVASALDGARPVAAPATGTRSRRVLAVAAAAVAVVAVAAGVINAIDDNGGSGSRTVAGRTQEDERAHTGAGESEDRSATEQAPSAVPPAREALAEPRNLGDLGDVTDPAHLRRAVTGGLSGGLAGDPLALSLDRPCLAGRAATDTPPIAVATGRFEGDAVLILVVPRALDAYDLVVLDAATCESRSTLIL
jgi:hypothetical protein